MPRQAPRVLSVLPVPTTIALEPQSVMRVIQAPLARILQFHVFHVHKAFTPPLRGNVRATDVLLERTAARWVVRTVRTALQGFLPQRKDSRSVCGVNKESLLGFQLRQFVMHASRDDMQANLERPHANFVMSETKQ
jgi:hypothetical protein